MVKTILLLLLKPFIWFLIFALLSWLLKDRRLKKVSIIIAAFILLIFSNEYLANQAVKSFEQDVQLPRTSRYEIGVILGGYARFNEQQGKVEFTESADRLLQTLLLYRKGIIKKILISGGNIDTLLNKNKEADIIAAFLRKIGIPESDIIVENSSKNTKENALFTAKKLHELNIRGKILVITSAWHIPRTKKVFEKYARPYHFDFFGANSRQSNNTTFISNVIPSLHALETWEILLKEIAGKILA